MRKGITLSLAALTLASAGLPSLSVAAQNEVKPIVITDVGGVDDKSFNQSAWELSLIHI